MWSQQRLLHIVAAAAAASLIWTFFSLKISLLCFSFDWYTFRCDFSIYDVIAQLYLVWVRLWRQLTVWDTRKTPLSFSSETTGA
jgi:hypothetical protein